MFKKLKKIGRNIDKSLGSPSHLKSNDQEKREKAEERFGLKDKKQPTDVSSNNTPIDTSNNNFTPSAALPRDENRDENDEELLINTLKESEATYKLEEEKRKQEKLEEEKREQELKKQQLIQNELEEALKKSEATYKLEEEKRKQEKLEEEKREQELKKQQENLSLQYNNDQISAQEKLNNDRNKNPLNHYEALTLDTNIVLFDSNLGRDKSEDKSEAWKKENIIEAIAKLLKITKPSNGADETGKKFLEAIVCYGKKISHETDKGLWWKSAIDSIEKYYISLTTDHPETEILGFTEESNY